MRRVWRLNGWCGPGGRGAAWWGRVNTSVGEIDVVEPLWALVPTPQLHSAKPWSEGAGTRRLLGAGCWVLSARCPGWHAQRGKTKASCCVVVSKEAWHVAVEGR